MRTPTSQQGITIIELMVAITVLALLIGFGVPSYSTWMANSQIRNAAESLQNGLRLAQAEAARRNTRVDLVLTDDAPTSATASPLPGAPSLTPATAGRNWVIPDPSAAGAVFHGKAAVEGSASVQLQSTTGTFSFSGVGRLMPTSLPAGSNEARIVFTNPPVGNRPLEVHVSLGGRVRMCDPAPSLPTGDARRCVP